MNTCFCKKKKKRYLIKLMGILQSWRGKNEKVDLVSNEVVAWIVSHSWVVRVQIVRHMVYG